MAEHSSQPDRDIADDLLDLIPRLLQQIRADIPREANSAHLLPEWRDISELRATTGQIRLLRILNTHQSCTMQELADLLDVAPPTATVMLNAYVMSRTGEWCGWCRPNEGNVALLSMTSFVVLTYNAAWHT